MAGRRGAPRRPDLLHGARERRREPARTADLLADFGDQHPGVEVGGSEIIAAAADANAETQAWVNYVLLGMVILFSAFALLNTLMLGVAGRVREFGLLRLVGGTRRQVLGMMRMEAVLMLLIGGTLGAAVATVTVLPFAKAVSGSFRPDIALVPAAGLAGGAALLGLLGTMLPTRAALRTRPSTRSGSASRRGRSARPDQGLGDDDVLAVEGDARSLVQPIAQLEGFADAMTERGVVLTRENSVDRQPVRRRRTHAPMLGRSPADRVPGSPPHWAHAARAAAVDRAHRWRRPAPPRLGQSARTPAQARRGGGHGGEWVDGRREHPAVPEASGTTVDPLRPARASGLVTSGPNRVTRNPMYVGMAGALVAHALIRGGWATVLPVAAFVAVIDRVQIRPEEAALRELFGEEYDAYCRRVRRWL